MGVPHPVITGVLDNGTNAYILEDYQIEMERQRPTYAELYTDEPVDTEKTALVSLGFEKALSKLSILNLLDCEQIHPGLFRTVGIEPVRQFLDADFHKQLIRNTLNQAFQALAGQFGLTFEDRTSTPRAERHSPIFLSTVRNALDQIRRVYGLESERWHLDLINEKLLLLPGQYIGDPVDLDKNLFVEENEDGVEFKIMPQMRPFIPFTWRNQNKVVDRVVFDKKADSMTLRLIDG